MNALPPLPPVVPIPPEPGEFGRVRRRALIRRLRVPAAAAVSGALVAVALSVVPANDPAADRIVATDEEPGVVQTYTPTPEPSVTPTPTPSSTPSPSPSVTPSPSQPTSSETSEATRSPSEEPPPVTPAPPTAYHGSLPPCHDDRPAEPPVSGVVVDRRGKPVSGITITSGECIGRFVNDQKAVATTDAQGRFSFPCIGTWAVAAPYRWYHGDRAIDVPYGFAWFGKRMAPVTCGTTHRLVLPDEATVTVQFVDANGDPIREAGHRISIHLVEDGATNFDDATSDAQGRATLRQLAPGGYTLYHPDGVRPEVRIDLTEAQDLIVEFALKVEPTTSPTPSETPSTRSPMTAP